MSRNTIFPPELAPFSEKELTRFGIRSLFSRTDKLYTEPSSKAFVPPVNFADHLDFFLRFCAACENSKIYIKAYTKDVMDGDVCLHRRGDILMEVQNIRDYFYNPQYWTEGYVTGVKTFIYKHPDYSAAEDTLRLTFWEPDSFILDYREKYLWRPVFDLMKQYNQRIWISDVSAANSADYSNWTGLLIHCGNPNSDLRYGYHDLFWYHVKKKRTK